MKKTLLFALALIAVGCAEPTPRNLDTLVQQGGVYLDRETMRPYSGPVFGLYGKSQLVSQSGTLVDGKWHGLWESYTSQGQRLMTFTYRNGDFFGPYSLYYDGMLREEGILNGRCGMQYIEGEVNPVTYDPCPPGLEDGN